MGQLAGGGPSGVGGAGGGTGLRRSSNSDTCSVGEDSETGMERTLVR